MQEEPAVDPGTYRRGAATSDSPRKENVHAASSEVTLQKGKKPCVQQPTNEKRFRPTGIIRNTFSVGGKPSRKKKRGGLGYHLTRRNQRFDLMWPWRFNVKCSFTNSRNARERASFAWWRKGGVDRQIKHEILSVKCIHPVQKGASIRGRTEQRGTMLTPRDAIQPHVWFLPEKGGTTLQSHKLRKVSFPPKWPWWRIGIAPGGLKLVAGKPSINKGAGPG